MTTQEILHLIPHMRFKLEAEEHKEALNEIEDRLKKSGTWIDHEDGRWVYAQCSECGTIHDVKTNYCPTCGADMRGTENE